MTTEMTIKEVSRRSGLELSHVYALIYHGDLKIQKLGRDPWYVDKNDLVEWLTSRENKTGLKLEGGVWLTELTTGADRTAIVAELLNGEPLGDQLVTTVPVAET